ncbi:MAG: organomercurial transporter MerC [Rhodanobacteraceae bacterium]|nr:MAG: organomercurial transporter MerC [Rhodanobacteraceae bacterium]
MSTTTRVADKAGVIGAIVGSFSCAMCFPAAASIGAAIGLGFLSHWEGLFVHTLIPIFALVALLANLAGWSSHGQWQRALAGSVGPVLVLIGAFGLTGVFGLTRGLLPADAARGTFYAGMIVMIVAAVWDLINPAHRRCAPAATKRQPDADAG